jgi:4'-phosphopantetheinyl transferase
VNGEPLVDSFGAVDECAFVLSPGEIDIWRVALEVHDLRYRELELWLSQEERRRASRFVFDRDRSRFVACRGRLRAILARYLKGEPHRIEFRYGPQGKPSLNPAADPSFFFNLSHSQNLALIAVRRSGEVGVDVESLRPIEEAEAIARRYFTSREHAALAALPPEERIAAFFRCWTRKEAMLKATGEGIGVSLDAVEVTLGPQEPPRVVSIRGSGDSAETWRLYHVAPRDGFIGAVAAQGDAERIAGWQWSD